jgi:Zn-finger nucleic acid-binding protein
MTDLAPRLPCPVCLGTTLEKVRVGPHRTLEVDHCRRCGGTWFEHGEVQRLRELPSGEVWKHVERGDAASRMLCHDCHAPLDRAAERCPACGWSNVLDCPECARPMKGEPYAGLRLDVCRDCRGVWFDRHELQAIWTTSFDQSLRRRKLSPGGALAGTADAGGEVLFHALFFAPDLVYYGARAAGHAAAASADAVSHLPGALAATPEAASAAFEAVGDAAGGVFEAIAEIIGGLFG